MSRYDWKDGLDILTIMISFGLGLTVIIGLLLGLVYVANKVFS